MPSIRYEIRPGAYYDSVVLMQLQRSLLELSGVIDSGVVMATPTNLELLEQNDMLPEGIGDARPEDLLIVLKVDKERDAQSAFASIDELIARRRSTSSGKFHPKSLASARNMLPNAKHALISVPGRFAADVAREALQLDMHVFLYSDNVSLEDERSLKELARSKGLLVMGPDCGTAIIHGIGFGFANRVRTGNIGLVGAAGTGLQAISSHIHALGGGVSHALGTGGRDLKADIGGITAMQALDLLDRDPETLAIVIVSKPPDPAVAAKLMARAQRSSKPVVLQFMGYAPPAERMGNLRFAVNFQEAAHLAVGLVDDDSAAVAAPRSAHSESNSRRYIRGLFSGGSLANETLRTLQVFQGPIYSNIAADPAFQLADPLQPVEHSLLDLGEDTFTVGRLHPMIDNELRIRMMRQEIAKPDVGILILDVVLGEGAHPDPASELSVPIAEAVQMGVKVAVILLGTEEDPQNLGQQREQLVSAGAHVFEDTLSMGEFVGQALSGSAPAQDTLVPVESLTAPVAAINVGLEIFYESLLAQGAQAVHVDWRPPAGGDEKLMAILKKMRE